MWCRGESLWCAGESCGVGVRIRALGVRFCGAGVRVCGVEVRVCGEEDLLPGAFDVAVLHVLDVAHLPFREASGFGVQSLGCGERFRLSGDGLGFGVQGSGFGVQGMGFRVEALGLRVLGLGFRVWGLGVWVRTIILRSRHPCAGQRGSGVEVSFRGPPTGENFPKLKDFLPESRGQNLVLTVLYVPHSLDCGHARICPSRFPKFVKTYAPINNYFAQDKRGPGSHLVAVTRAGGSRKSKSENLPRDEVYRGTSLPRGKVHRGTLLTPLGPP